MSPLIVRRGPNVDVFAPAPRTNVVALVVLAASLAIGVLLTIQLQQPLPAIAGAVIGVVLMQSPKVAQQWERAVVLRLGKYKGSAALACSGSFRSSTRCRRGSTSG